MTISKASYLLSLFHVCHPDFHSGHSTQIELTKIINQILKLHCWESFNGFLFSSVAQLSPTLCDPMYFGTPGFPVHDQLLELAHSCPLSRWCHPTLSSSVIPLSSCLQSFWASVFSSESVLPIRWPKYWIFSFSISPSNEYSGLISCRIDWFDLLAVQGTQESSLTPQFCCP